MNVSVIIPLYNKAEYISRALDSIVAQSYGDFEVIVVDDGSTDDGPDIVAAYPDERIHLIRQENTGPGGARNRGLGAARTEYVAFLDADDEWLPDYLADSIALLERYGPDVACVSCSYYEWPSGHPTAPLWEKRGIEEGLFRASIDMDPNRLVHQLAFMSSWSTVARKAVLDRWGGFYSLDRCLYGEDAYLWLKLLFNETVLVNLSPLVRYHTEASDLAHSFLRARPVEPFLTNPEELREACPRALRPLLERTLAIRAHRTACVLSFWGDPEAARELLRRFAVPAGWRLPYYFSARVCATPFGSWILQVSRTNRLLGRIRSAITGA